ncbi:MAG: hypothetical protein RXR65_07285 [Hydrogenobaculum sp.]
MKKVTKTNEQLFYETLYKLFVGPKIEGKGGFAKLYQAKEMYYQKLVSVLQQEMEKYSDYKEDVYGLLYNFLNLFDSEFYTIYVKDKNNQQAFWDMQRRLYYVKTDIIFQSMVIESNGLTFFFDASNTEYKKNNERRNLVYELKKIEDNTITFLVHYIESNITTDIEGILKALDGKITEQELKKVFKKYERKLKQSERDFFIHKDIRSFLQEKLKLWLGEYLYNNVLTDM